MTRWPINGKAPGGQGILRKGDNLSSTTLYVSHDKRSASEDRNINFKPVKLANISRIMFSFTDFQWLLRSDHMNSLIQYIAGYITVTKDEETIAKSVRFCIRPF